MSPPTTTTTTTAPTPAYYPAGWDRERMLDGAATGEFKTLSEEQFATFREGFKAELGEEAFAKFCGEMWEREKRAKGIPPPPVSEPPFMQIQSRFPLDPWGFVVFKSPEIADEAEWARCKERFDLIIRESTDFYKGFEGLEECLSKMKFQWVEDVSEGDASVDAIARLYTTLFPTLPPGLSHSLCLYITPSSLHSILDSLLPSSANRRYRPHIPYAVAVSHAATAADAPPATWDDETDGDWWRGWFNVALEGLLDGLFPMLARQSRGPMQIGGHVRGEDIYVDHTRFGVHKAGGGGFEDRRR